MRMITYDMQNPFTVMLAFDHIFLAFLVESLHQNHVLLTLSLYAFLFWAIPKEEFALFSVTLRIMGWKLQEERFGFKIGIFIFNGQRYQKMSAFKRGACFLSLATHIQSLPATWRGCCKGNGGVRLGGLPILRV